MTSHWVFILSSHVFWSRMKWNFGMFAIWTISDIPSKVCNLWHLALMNERNSIESFATVPVPHLTSTSLPVHYSNESSLSVSLFLLCHEPPHLPSTALFPVSPPPQKKLDKTNASHCVILGINDEISNGVFTLVRVYLSLMAVCLRREEWAKGFMSTRANGVYVSAAVQWLAGLPVNGPSCKPSPPLKRQRA